MTQTLKKPDFRGTAKKRKELLSYDSALKAIIDGEQALSDEAADALNDLKTEDAYKTLNETPLSALNAAKQGIRVSALANAGLSSIGELAALSLSEIDSIKGIGTGSAGLIKKTAEEIEKTVLDNSRAKLSADSKTPAGMATVAALYKLIHTREIRKSAAKLYSLRHRSVLNAVEESSAVKNSFFWIFSGKEKKAKAVSGAEKLEKLYNSTFTEDAGRIIDDYESTLSVPEEKAWQDFITRSAFYFSALEELTEKNASAKEIADTLDRIRSDVPEELADAIDKYELRLDGFKTALRSYQTFGTKYALYQKNTLLGDEMGLGKTVQALAALQSLANTGSKRFVVVCPASVLINWVREIQTFSTLTPLLIRDSAAADNALKWSNTGGIAVVNYEGLQKFIDILPENYTSDMTVIDEAHYIKNPEAKRTVTAKALLTHSENMLLMTGTPLENRIDEMKSLIGMIAPDIAKKIQLTEDSWSGKGFRKKIAPVYLRRTREDVLTELPELIIEEEICPVNEDEKQAYKADVKKGDFMGMRQVSFKNVPAEKSSKLKRILELADTAREQGRKAIVFSYFKNTLESVKAALGDRATEIIDGSVSAHKRQEILDSFSKSEAGTVLIAQIIAGGTGLNIQAASVIILCETQIKPSLETQAISRSYRMGQLNSVLVYRIISDDTIDEDILKILKDKQDIFDKFADGSDMADAGSAKWIADAVSAQQKLFAPESAAASP